MSDERVAVAPSQWDAIWLDANLATMASGISAPYGTIEDGAIAVKDKQICWVGPRSKLPREALNDIPIYKAEGRWITPGLVDCHTHLVYAGNRAKEFELRLTGMTYEQIARQGGGILSTVKATREASEQTLLDSALIRLSALMAEGVTTVEIKSGYGLDLETERKMLRVARALIKEKPINVVTTLLGAHAPAPEYQGRADDYIDFVCKQVLPAIAQEKLADAVDVFCEGIGFSVAQTARVFQAAQALGLPVKLHADQLSDLGGAALAAHYRALSADHLEYVSEDGVKAMADADTVAVLLPGAFYYLGAAKKPPVDLFRRYGVKLALATDSNPGTSPVCSLLLMLNMGCALFQLTPEEALAGVTRNAAKALGQENRLGTLEVGKNADFVLWDIEQPAELAYRFGFNPCHRVIKDGTPISSL